MSTEPLVNGFLTASHHAFNADGSLCAVANNGESVTIFESKDADCSKWTAVAELNEHGGHVSGIDWAHATNQIVTCGHDRNAYVWKYDEEKKEWAPALVILRINRGATDVKWSPDGRKFAVCSGMKCVPICTFDDTHDWWACTMVKKHKSTVLCVDWSPNGKFIVTGACDFKCRIFSAFSAGIDDEANDDYAFWPKANEFGEVLQEFDQAKAWVQSVSWSPSGYGIAFAGHGSTLSFADFTDGAKDVYTFNSKTLPYNHVDYLTADSVVACGYDLNPTVLKKAGAEWVQDKKLDDETQGDNKKVATGGAAAARAMFAAADQTGNKAGDNVTSIKTKHTNVIVGVKVNGNSITTSSIDGRVIRWTA